MRSTILISSLLSLVAADCMTYTGPSMPWSAGDVWTSLGSCSGGGITLPPPMTTTWTTTYSSGSSTWTTVETGSPSSSAGSGHGGYGNGGKPADSSEGSWGTSSGAEATATPASTFEVSSTETAPATFTGGASQQAIGAGVVAVAGLALLL
jgi:hypothetical protein